tara:strand:- start:295 stop:687 length:393 start_codon:yes stop_codon:yes gene_type:complete
MKTVFTNGCFDIVHRGHLELLEYCKNIGDRVVVGLNSDKSVKKIKGPDRPINNERDRKFLLESLTFVDKVYIFDEETPIELIKQVKPDIIVKGGDYSIEEVVGHKLAKVLIFKIVNGYSTTKIVKNISNR